MEHPLLPYAGDLQNPNEPWCGIHALRAVHLEALRSSFPGARYLRTEFCPEFCCWTTVYDDGSGDVCVIVETWKDGEGKTGRMAIRKPRSTLALH